MKKPSFILAIFLLAGIMVCIPISNRAFLSSLFSPAKNELASDIRLPKPKVITNKPLLQNLSKQTIGQSAYYSLTDLVSKGIIRGKIDTKNEVCIVQKGRQTLRFERNIPVVLNSGLYESLPASTVFMNQECYLPVATIDNLVAKADDTAVVKQADAIKRTSSFQAKQLATYLSFLHSPIPGAHVSTVNSSLPGAPRTYRKGVHEGLDWYTYGTGKIIDTHTPVLSMGTGTVVRADFGYKEMSTPERNKWLTIGSKNNGQTPTYILDKLRGRTVWVQFNNGVMARYCHLSNISNNIKVGKQVKAGDIIGYVGNSGTSDGALRNNKGLHLHLDIIIYGNWVWGKYSVAERRMILETVFNKDKQ